MPEFEVTIVDNKRHVVRITADSAREAKEIVEYNTFRDLVDNIAISVDEEACEWYIVGIEECKDEDSLE